MKAVRYDRFGDVDVLKVEEVADPAPGPGQVLVEVRAAGINPGEAAIRRGDMAKRWPSTFPSGQGSDFAGVVKAVGPDVRHRKIGDVVLGFVETRSSQAELVVAEAKNLVGKPDDVSWEAAGAIPVVGTTAHSCIHAVGLKKGETVVVAGAAGGVGSLVLQLARNAGAKAIGLASEASRGAVEKYGGVWVSYDKQGLGERIEKAAGGKPDAAIDLFGGGYVELALAMGIPKERVNTIIDFAAVEKLGVKSEGQHESANAEVLADLAELIAAGKLEVPIARVYPLAEVQDAYRELEKRHTHGKIVLRP